MHCGDLRERTCRWSSVPSKLRGREYPTLFSSQALNPAQRNYSTYERELLAVVKACDGFRVYLLGRELTLRTEAAALSAIFNSPLSSTSRVAKWPLALQPFRFVVTHIKGEENVAAERLSRIPWPVATPKAVDVIQLAVELEVDSAGEEESDSYRVEEGEEPFQEEDSAQGEVILLAIDLVMEEQKGDTDWQRLGQLGNGPASATRDDMKASSPYLRLLAHYLDRIDKVAEMLVLR